LLRDKTQIITILQSVFFRQPSWSLCTSEKTCSALKIVFMTPTGQIHHRWYVSGFIVIYVFLLVFAHFML
ncbi:MAG: hypothetical protein QXQ33_03675, partial [Nitrososphaerota archaeon]